MQSPVPWPRVEEPLTRTLRRNIGIALAVGSVFALRRGDFGLVLPCSLLALWVSLGGHYVEILFLNGVRPRIARATLTQRGVRLIVWLAGGVLLFSLMAVTARWLGLGFPRSRAWWLGALTFIGIELTAHLSLALRGLPNIYRGDG